jgi:hypothetical protein
VTFAGQNFRRESDRFSEITGDFGQRRKEEITETVTAEFSFSTKAMSDVCR